VSTQVTLLFTIIASFLSVSKAFALVGVIIISLVKFCGSGVMVLSLLVIQPL
jgi:hypothetical protein